MALELYKRGEYAQATELLQWLPEAGFEVPGTCCHLARIALVTDDHAAAEEYVGKAWANRSAAPPYVVPRILWLQFAVALTSREDAKAVQPPKPATLLGRIRTSLQPEGTHLEWTMDPVLAHLQPKLSAENHALLTVLVAALSDRTKLSDLDQFPAWREAKPEPLEDGIA